MNISYVALKSMIGGRDREIEQLRALTDDMAALLDAIAFMNDIDPEAFVPDREALDAVLARYREARQ